MSDRSRRLWSLLIALAMLLQFAPPHVHAHAEEPALLRGTFRYAGMYNNQKDSELDYVYSDAYFAGDAHVYDPSLSTMSLALEMSSWSSLDEINWVDKSANARDLLADVGFVDYAQNEFWNDVPTVESIGVVAAHKDLPDATLIALAVRGGGYFSEWGSNVLVGAAAGYLLTAKMVMSYIDYLVRSDFASFSQVGFIGKDVHNYTAKW